MILLKIEADYKWKAFPLRDCIHDEYEQSNLTFIYLHIKNYTLFEFKIALKPRQKDTVSYGLAKPDLVIMYEDKLY